MVGMTSDRDRVQRTSGKLSLVDTSDISINKDKKRMTSPLGLAKTK